MCALLDPPASMDSMEPHRVVASFSDGEVCQVRRVLWQVSDQFASTFAAPNSGNVVAVHSD